MPGPLVHDMHPLEHHGRTYWLEINITAQLIGKESAGGSLPMRVDLGRRIAEMIRADIAADAAGAAV
jgi:hypothetical protein